MASYNKVILMGNLTRDPDVRAAGASGMKVARLGIAINEKRRDRNGQTIDMPVFVDVDAWDRLAELCGQFLTKGRTVLVEGRLQMDSWERDGIKHQKLRVRASAIKFLPPADKQAMQENKMRAAQNASFVPVQNPLESDPDDIPF